MSESTELVRELLAGGLNYADIGEALGRDRSLVRQVGVGAKPGNNLRDALAGLRERLAGVPAAESRRAARAATVPAPERRQTATGKPARVRRSMRHEGAHYSVAAAKRQGARGGAKGPAAVLRRADEDRTAAVTLSFPPHSGVTINGTSGGRSVAHGMAGSVDINLGQVGELRDELRESGMSLSEYAVSQAMAAGYVSAPSLSGAVEQLGSLEVRTF